MTDVLCKLRLRLASGSEMEVEGTPEFIRTERDYFLSAQTEPVNAKSPKMESQAPIQPHPDIIGQIWDKAVEDDGNELVLRGKLKASHDGNEACLVLLGASETLLKLRKPTAFQVAKWLRNSGYPVERIDRILQESIQKGEILASGSRRARRYELTLTGKSKAFLLAQELASLIE